MRTCLALSTAALLACTALTGCGSTETTGDEMSTAAPEAATVQTAATEAPADQGTTTTDPAEDATAASPSTEAATTDAATPPASAPAAPPATEDATAAQDDEAGSDETEDDTTKDGGTQDETTDVDYPEDPAVYAQDFVDAWAAGDTARVEQLGGPRMAGITMIFDLDPVTVEATDMGQEDPAVAYAASDGLHVRMSTSRLGEGGAVTGVAVTGDDGSLVPQAGAVRYADAFLAALTSQDEEEVDRMAAPGEVREWLATSYDPELDGTDYVLSGVSLVVDEPLEIIFSFPDDEDYQFYRVGLSDDAPELEDDGAVVLFTPVAIFGFGT